MPRLLAVHLQKQSIDRSVPLIVVGSLSHTNVLRLLKQLKSSNKLRSSECGRYNWSLLVTPIANSTVACDAT
jgi:hypothetical protein